MSSLNPPTNDSGGGTAAPAADKTCARPHTRTHAYTHTHNENVERGWMKGTNKVKKEAEMANKGKRQQGQSGREKQGKE